MTRSQRGGIIFTFILLLTLVVVGALVYTLRRPLLRAAGGYWVVNDSLEPAEAILLLAGDNYPADRAARAAEIYHNRWAPRIVASGRQLRSYTGQAELTQRDLVERRVPAEAVIRFPQAADNTLEEAQALRHLVVERGWRRILVVTSNYHTRRARYIFRKVFPLNVDVRVVAASDSDYNPDHWWQSRRSVKLFFQEAAGLCVALWELRSAGATLLLASAPHPVAPGPRGCVSRIIIRWRFLLAGNCPALHAPWPVL